MRTSRIRILDRLFQMNISNAINPTASNDSSIDAILNLELTRAMVAGREVISPGKS